MTTTTSTTVNLKGSCSYCGSWHTGRCPKVKAIEYYPDGTVKRVEFHPEPAAPAPLPYIPYVPPVQPWPPNGPWITCGGSSTADPGLNVTVWNAAAGAAAPAAYVYTLTYES